MTYVANNLTEKSSTSHEVETKSPEPGNKSFFENLEPKSALIVGLVTSALTLCTVGFVILLIILANSN